MTPPHLTVVADNTRKRRQVAPAQAAIARAGRVAQALGPNWRLIIKGEVVELFQGEPPMTPRLAPELDGGGVAPTETIGGGVVVVGVGVVVVVVSVGGRPGDAVMKV